MGGFRHAILGLPAGHAAQIGEADRSCLDVLVARYPKNERAKLQTVVEVAHRIVYGLLDQNLLFNDRATGRVLDDSVLVDELTAAVVAYIEHRVK